MATHLKVSDKAPFFTGQDQNGDLVSLKEFRGRKLVLFFYPEDDTPACTIEACNLRDNYQLLRNNGFEVIGISPDNSSSHKKFEKKYSLPFALVADENRKIINRYGVWGEKQLYGRRYMGLNRTTFVIDEKGIIRHIFLKPRNRMHAEEIIAKCGSI
jgi:thioredoxin-dependent peroxiredoxin